MPGSARPRTVWASVLGCALGCAAGGKSTPSVAPASPPPATSAPRSAAPPGAPVAVAPPPSSNSASENTPPPGYARLGVVSEPPGARITVDGRLVGETPMARLWLEPGEHTVVLTLAGYEPTIEHVRVTAGQQAAVAAWMHEGADPAGPAAPSGPSYGRDDDYDPRSDCAANRMSCNHDCWSDAQSCKMDCRHEGPCDQTCEVMQHACERRCWNCR